MGREIDNDPALIRDLAFAYTRIGDVQGNSGAANLGDYNGAVASYRKSLEWHAKLHGNLDDRLAAIDTTVKLAKSLKWIGQLTPAEAAFERAGKDLAVLKATTPAAQQPILIIFRSNLHRAWSEHMQVLDKHEKVRELLTISVADLQQAIAQDPSNVRLRRGLAADAVTLSRSLMALDQWADSVRVAALGLQVIRELIGPNPPIREQARLIPPGIQLCEILQRAPAPVNDIPRALVLDKEMLAIAEKLVALDAANGRNQMLLTNVVSGYGEHLRAVWRWPEALAAYEKSVTIADSLLKKSPANGYYQDILGTDLVLLGQLQFEMHDDAPALANLRRGADLLEKSVGAGRLFVKPSLDLAKDCLAVMARQQP
jgi:tetratricopeptide (TPR) repeat protein